MNLVGWANRLAQARHTGRAMKAAKVLNTVGTIRGAITTVLLAASAIGGVATVNNVRTDLATKDQDKAARSAAARPTPTRTPAVDAASLRAQYEQRLLQALQANAAALDDLTKVAVIPSAKLQSVVEEAKAKLQARYDQAVTQIAELAVAASPSPGASVPSSSPFSVITLDALVRVATADMNAIVLTATRAATTTPTQAPATVAPKTPSPTQTPVRTPTPTPTPTPRKT